MVLALGAAAFALTILIQGGFFARTYIPALILVFIGGLWEWKRETSLQQSPDKCIMTVEVALFSLLSALYILSASYHEVALKEWDKMIYISGIGILYYYFRGLYQEERYRLKKLLVIIGMIECAIGFVAYAGVSIEGVIINARFMGTFQYANANGLFLGMLLVIQWAVGDVEKPIQSSFRMFQTIFFVLTFSFGAMICYAIGLFLLSRYQKGALSKGVWEFVIGGLFAGSLYLLKFRVGNWWVVYGMLALILVFCVCYGEIYRGVYEIVYKYKFKTFYIRMVWCMLAISEILAGSYFFGSRIGGTGMERLTQMWDGLKIVCENWCLGIGPHQLEELLKNMHVDYETSLIHNSYIQIGVESGIFALGIVLGLLFLGAKGVYKSDDKYSISGEIAVVVMTVFHFSVDISFFFFPIIGILIMCLSEGKGYGVPKMIRGVKFFKK